MTAGSIKPTFLDSKGDLKLEIHKYPHDFADLEMHG